MAAYSKIPKIVNAINKGVVRAVAGKNGGMKAEVKKKYPKTPKPTGMKGRGTTSTSVANPKSGVKVKPPAKPKPNKPNAAKTMFKNDSSRTRASDRAMKEYEKNVSRHGFRPTDPSFESKLAERVANNTQLKRKPNLKKK